MSLPLEVSERLLAFTPQDDPIQFEDPVLSPVVQRSDRLQDAEPQEILGVLDGMAGTPFLSRTYLSNVLDPDDAAEFLALLRPVLRAARVPEGRLP